MDYTNLSPLPSQRLPPAPAPSTSVSLSETNISGFYKVTDEKTATFYATTAWPIQDPLTLTPVPIGAGWTATGVTGMAGNLILTGAQNVPGKNEIGPYNWTFQLQSDTNQAIQGVQYASAVTLYPPDINIRNLNLSSGSLDGFYLVASHVPTLYLTGGNIPWNMTKGWTIGNLPTINGTLTVDTYVPITGEVVTSRSTGINNKHAPVSNSYVGYVVLEPQGLVPNSDTPVYVKGVTVNQPPSVAPSYGANLQYISDYSNVVVQIDSRIQGKGGAPLRDLGTGIDGLSFKREVYSEVKGKGYNSGTSLALYANGPQEKFVNGSEDDIFNSKYSQYSNFVIYQRNIPISGSTFLGSTALIEIRPQQIGDLLSNMYFKCTLPALSSSSNAYTNQVGRAIIKQIDFMINDTIVETIYDDWFFIRDQVFLDADEQIAMFSAVNNGSNTYLSNVTSNFDVIVPLEFFFCRRHSGGNKGRERLRKPFFPVCAMWNQKLYFRITFNPWVWLTNDLPYKDILNPSFILEEILLTTEERLYYQSTSLTYIANRVQKESTLTFSGNNPQLELTASFPVQMIAWFFRNKKYESVDSGLYYDSRYLYGYTTSYIKAATPLNFVTGTVNYIDVIKTAKITLNNIDILSTFQGSLYYSFKQPMEHGLTIPANNIYIYSFGLNPKEYNSGGYINFSKLNSQTTNLSLTFLPEYSSQISQGYNLYLFYYGYSVLQFQNGFARRPFL